MDRILRPGLFILLFVIAGVYAFVFSESGILVRGELEKGRKQLVDTIDFLKRDNARMGQTVDGYSRGDYPPEILTGRGFVKPGDVVVHVKGSGGDAVRGDEKTGTDYLFISRVAWVVISLFSILVYLWYSLRDDGEET